MSVFCPGAGDVVLLGAGGLQDRPRKWTDVNGAKIRRVIADFSERANRKIGETGAYLSDILDKPLGFRKRS